MLCADKRPQRMNQMIQTNAGLDYPRVQIQSQQIGNAQTNESVTGFQNRLGWHLQCVRDFVSRGSIGHREVAW